jgi:hypothetical protein
MDFFAMIFFFVIGGIVFSIAGSATAISWFTAKWKDCADEQCVVKVVRLKKIDHAATRVFWLCFAAYMLHGLLGIKEIFLATGVPGIGSIDVLLSVYVAVLVAVIVVRVFYTASIRYYKKKFRKDPFTQQSIIGPG